MSHGLCIDTDNLKAHRVAARALERYQRGMLPAVVATCGKTWAPKLVNQDYLKNYPKCDVCFPPGFKYAIAC
jgi:hypothetical protein